MGGRSLGAYVCGADGQRPNWSRFTGTPRGSGRRTAPALSIVPFAALAWTFGIAFQYFSIVLMREDIGRLQGNWAAIKADTLSIISFQLGLFGCTALYHLVFFKPRSPSPAPPTGS